MITEEELRDLLVEADAMAEPTHEVAVAPAESAGGLVLIAWAAVLIPIAWGIYETIMKAAVLLK